MKFRKQEKKERFEIQEYPKVNVLSVFLPNYPIKSNSTKSEPARLLIIYR